MFICGPCLKENFTNELGWVQSHGKCEMCEEHRICSDIPSRHLTRKPVTSPTDKFIVQARIWTPFIATIEVEAADAEEAKRKIDQLWDEDKIRWRTDDDTDPRIEFPSVTPKQP